MGHSCVDKIRVKQLGYHHNKDIKSAPLGYPQLHASELNMVNTTHQQPLQALLAEYLSDDEDPCPPYSLPPPPADAIYSSEKEAMDAINEFTKQHGYALTTKSSKRHEGDGQIKVRYVCRQCQEVPCWMAYAVHHLTYWLLHQLEPQSGRRIRCVGRGDENYQFY